MQVTTVTMHPLPHFDEVLAYVMAVSCGRDLFPGIEAAPIKFISPNPEGNIEPPSNGVLSIGVPGGSVTIDEHTTNGRKEGECASTLMCDHLGLKGNPAWTTIVAHALEMDTNPNAHPLEISRLVKDAHQSGMDGREVIEWASIAILALYERLKRGENPRRDFTVFHSTAAKYLIEYFAVHKSKQERAEMLERCLAKGDNAFAAAANELRMPNHPWIFGLLQDVGGATKAEQVDQFGLLSLTNDASSFLGAEQLDHWIGWAIVSKLETQRMFLACGEELASVRTIEFDVARGVKGKISAIESDNPMWQRFFRTKKVGRPDVLVQKKSSGQVQIYTNHMSGVWQHCHFTDIVRALRYGELCAQGAISPGQEVCRKALSSQGFGQENRFYWPGNQTQYILNGSLSAPEVPPTEQPLEDIVRLVQIGMQPLLFHGERFMSCRRGNCTSTARNPCLWYGMGLERCIQVRQLRR